MLLPLLLTLGFTPKVLFKIDAVSLKDATAVVEPLQATTFVVTWFDGDLKRVPVEREFVHCEPIALEGKWTKLSCDGLGDVYVKAVKFTKESQ